MATICRLFGYNYIHTAKFLKTIMKELGSADGVSDMKAASTPPNLCGDNGTDNAVENSVARKK